MKQSDPIYELLSRTKTIAVVGLSESPLRPSHGVSAYMQAAGYKIIPYNYIEGAKILLAHMWESRRGPGGLNGVIGPEELADFRHFTALPRKVLETLGPPRPVIA